MCSSRRRTRSRPPMTRRTRTKTRRPKYLSLRLQLAQRSEAAPDVMPSDDHHLACLLDPGYGGATLTDLLGGGGLEPPPPPLSSPSPTSSSMNWDDADEEKLARRALRGRERWVFCRSTSEEVASNSGGRIDPLWCGAPQQGLSLKLDYEEILTAWSDRGPLYIDGEGAQVVPELHDTTTMFVEVGSTVGSSWRVPEAAPSAAAEGREEEVRSREAMVRRYKEKRRSRLFAKRIRYEVRKLNAEKRPRMKGRFVKRKEDE